MTATRPDKGSELCPERPRILREETHPLSERLLEAILIDIIEANIDTTTAKDVFAAEQRDSGSGPNWYAADSQCVPVFDRYVRHCYAACPHLHQRH